MTAGEARETFASKFGAIVTMIGVAVGLGNVWRFPYLVGRNGGAAFVLFYTAISLLIGVPGLIAEWSLGRHTRRSTLGAFERAGFPAGKAVGRFLFLIVIAATAYYTNVVGWVLYFAVSELVRLAGTQLNAAAVLPPASGFVPVSFGLQIACTAAVTVASAVTLDRGLRAGIERVSLAIIPMLFVVLVVLIWRSVTLPGAGEGIRWYIGKFQLSDLTPTVMVSALGHAIFSLSLGGTFMVTYGSYLRDGESLLGNALWTTFGDTFSGLMAGFVIFPAVFAFGLEPSSGPGLVFETIPRIFAQMPGGALFGLLFFVGLFGAGFLSDIAALEVLVAGITDNLGLSRRRAVWMMSGIVLLVSLIPMISMRVFVPWDLTFGSGMQTLGALLAVLAAGWFMGRAALLEQVAPDTPGRNVLIAFIRYVIPVAMVGVGLWWLLTDVLHVVTSA